jgi:hypothetical protein
MEDLLGFIGLYTLYLFGIMMGLNILKGYFRWPLAVVYICGGLIAMYFFSKVYVVSVIDNEYAFFIGGFVSSILVMFFLKIEPQRSYTMGFIEKEIERAKKALIEAGEKIINTPPLADNAMTLPVSISDEMLNKAAVGVCDKVGEIKSLKIAMHDGWCQADAHIIHNLVEFDVTVNFEIVRFELSKQAHVIELRQKGELVTDAEGWRNQIVVAVIKTFISSFVSKYLVQWGLKDKDGITVVGTTLTVDLAKLGVMDALYEALTEKVRSTAPWLMFMLKNGTGKLEDYVSISSADCKEGELVVNIQRARNDKS